MVNKNQESFSRLKQERVIYSRRYGFDAVFIRADESGRISRRPRLPDGEVAGRVRGRYCYFAFECLVNLVCSEIRKRPGHPFSGYFFGAAWRSLVEGTGSLTNLAPQARQRANRDTP